MPDQSQLDFLYFVDGSRYNCPYCNRGHISYRIARTFKFDWNENKKCYVIFVRCAGCEHESMHLSYEDLTYVDSTGFIHFKEDAAPIDSHMFYSVPTSYHVINEHIPSTLRDLLDEAQGCLKSNFLTGASACLRKIIYEMAAREKAEGSSYEERIKNLKQKYPAVDDTYFDTLLTIQQVTSDKVHEESYDGWESKHIKVILAALLEILTEVYVTPKMKDIKRQAILDLKLQVTGKGQEPPPKATREPAS